MPVLAAALYFSHPGICAAPSALLKMCPFTLPWELLCRYSFSRVLPQLFSNLLRWDSCCTRNMSRWKGGGALPWQSILVLQLYNSCSSTKVKTCFLCHSNCNTAFGLGSKPQKPKASVRWHKKVLVVTLIAAVVCTNLSLILKCYACKTNVAGADFYDSFVPPVSGISLGLSFVMVPCYELIQNHSFSEPS